MNKLKIFVVLFFVGGASAIHGGNLAVHSNEAFGVAMIDNRLLHFDSETEISVCNGALISAWVVITLGRCCYSTDDNLYTSILLGAGLLTDDGQLYYMDKFKLIGDPQEAVDFRFCLIKLHRRINYSKNISPYTLPADDVQLPTPGDRYDVFGYGVMALENHSDTMDYQRSKGTPPIKDVDYCKRFIGEPLTQSEVHCLGAHGEGSPFLTKSDHGAPWVHNNYLYGLGLSYYKDYPMNYTHGNPSYYLSTLGKARDQILEGMAELMGKTEL